MRKGSVITLVILGMIGLFMFSTKVNDFVSINTTEYFAFGGSTPIPSPTEVPTPVPTPTVVPTPTPTVAPTPRVSLEAPCEHLYMDYRYQDPVTLDDIFTIYVNGSTKMVEKDSVSGENITVNYKQVSLFTDLKPTYVYQYDEKKQKLIASTSKIIVGITTTKAKPSIAKGKIVADKAAGKIAKAAIKNGCITVTATGAGADRVYLWVARLRSNTEADTIVCCPIEIKVAPTALKLSTTEITGAGSMNASAVSYSNKGRVAIGDSESLDLYLYPTYKLDKTLTITEDAHYTYTIATGMESYLSVTGDDDNPYHFVLTGKGLKDAKKTTVRIIFSCAENGRKVTYSATVENPVTDISLGLDASSNLKATGEDNSVLLLEAEGGKATTDNINVTTTAILPDSATTDTAKVSVIKDAKAYSYSNNKLTVTKPTDTEQKKITATWKAGKLVIKNNKAASGTTAYILLWYNDADGDGKKGHKLITVTIK